MSSSSASGHRAARAASSDRRRRPRRFKDFKGAAATIRFNDGALELELAGDAARDRQGRLRPATTATTCSPRCPTDTAAAVGVGFYDGLVHRPGRPDVAALRRRHAEELLCRCVRSRPASTCPATPRPLAGESLAVGARQRLRPRDPRQLRRRLRRPGGRQGQGRRRRHRVACSTRSAARWAADTTPIDSDSDGDMVADRPERRLPPAGARGRRARGRPRPSATWCRRPTESSAVLFVNFDAGDSWLTKLAERRPAGRPTTSSRSRASASAPGRTATPATPCSASPPTDRPGSWGHSQAVTGQLGHSQRVTGQLEAQSARVGTLERASTARSRVQSAPSARSAADGVGDRGGDADQVGRGDLEVEAAPAGRDEDRGVRRARCAVHDGRVRPLLADGGDAAGDVAGRPLGRRRGRPSPRGSRPAPGPGP